MNKIKKILRKFGFIHESELTQEFLLLEIGKIIGDPMEYSIPKKFEEQFFKDLAAIDRIHEYLDATLAADMRREFSSPIEQRDLIHGAFSRTAYIKGKIKSVAK